jgi:aspartate 1-decarboxylase
MAVPFAPLEGAGDKIQFVIDDNAGTNRANLIRGHRTTLLNGTQVAAMGTYDVSGALENGNMQLTGAAAIAISGSVLAQWAIVKARSTNVGTVYVGKSDVTADTNNTTGGFPLDPGESVGVPCSNLSQIFIRGTTGDGVAWIASTD